MIAQAIAPAMHRRAESCPVTADEVRLPPLRFEPQFKPTLWGGQKLRDLLPAADVPTDEPIGEAWLLSDHCDHPSRVSVGPLKGRTIRDVLARAGSRVLGGHASAGFPLLLKFLDAREHLSVQVHPDDDRAGRLTGIRGARGKTEAWVVLHAEPGSRVYAGLKPGVSHDCLRKAVSVGQLAECLHSFHPRVGDCLFIPAGTVHALGAGVMVFEVQQTSDLTYRLHDWDRVDARTGKPRGLHLDAALECTDCQGPVHPVRPMIESVEPAMCERLVTCDHFQLWRKRADRPFRVGADGHCRAVVVLEGSCAVKDHLGEAHLLWPGEVLLLPAELGECACVPDGAVTLLECGVPRG